MNSISPSLVDTPMARASEASGYFPGVDVVGPMVPLGRAGTPADIAAACSYLCSEEGGSYITGQIRGQRWHVHLEPERHARIYRCMPVSWTDHLSPLRQSDHHGQEYSIETSIVGNVEGDA